MPEDDLLTVEVQARDSAAIVRLDGELDLSTVGRVRDALRALPGPYDRLVLDLSGLTFIDSTGLNLAVEEHRRAESGDFQLVFAGVGGPTLELLRNVALDTVLPMAPDVESALSL